MPSPIGHALAGLIAGGLVAPDPAGRPSSAPVPLGRMAAVLRHPLVGPALLLGALGVSPDLDFLFGTHSTWSHSVGAVAVVAVVAAAVARRARAAWACAAALAYGSHILLDWLGSDTTPPIGIMALWPFSGGFYQSDLYIFMAISRRYWLANFWTHNLQAVIREVLILLAPALAVAAWRVSRWRKAAAGPAGSTVPASGQRRPST